MLRQVAFAHAIRCQLRGEDPAGEIERLAGPVVAKAATGRANPANALLDSISQAISKARTEDRIDSVQQASFERVLTDIANAQGGMERIKNTPLPSGFRFFPSLFTRLFCILLPVAIVETLGLFTPIGSTLVGLIFLAALSIGEDLMDPFSNSPHDVPLSAMCRTIEIDLKQSIGQEAPAKLQPVDGVLW